jgi:hypothetical protein
VRPPHAGVEVATSGRTNFEIEIGRIKHMARPTDNAKQRFTEADMHIGQAGAKLKALKAPNGFDEERHQAELDMWRGLWLTNQGLIDLATGLRATYMLLEEVKALLLKRS